MKKRHRPPPAARGLWPLVVIAAEAVTIRDDGSISRGGVVVVVVAVVEVFVVVVVVVEVVDG